MTMTTPTTPERDPLALAMLAAWVGVEPDQLPATMRAHTCADTMARWKKVGEAAVEHADASLQAEIADLHSMLDLQTDLVDRLLTAVERLGQDIGGERPSAILPLLGPCNDRARTLLNKDKSNGQ